MSTTQDLLRRLLSALPEEMREDFVAKIKTEMEQEMTPAEIILMYATMSAASFRLLCEMDEDDPRRKPVTRMMAQNLSELGEFLEKHDSTKEKFQGVIAQLRAGAMWVEENGERQP